MGGINQEILRDLIREVKKGTFLGELESRFSVIIGLLRFHQPFVGESAEELRALVNFLDEQARKLVKEKLGTWDESNRALQGLILWVELEVRPLVEDRLRASLQIVRSHKGVPEELWLEWQRRYGLPPSENPIARMADGTRYRWMILGRKLLAERLKRLLTLEKVDGTRFQRAKEMYRKAMGHRLSHLPDRILQDVYVEPRLVQQLSPPGERVLDSQIFSWLRVGKLVLILGEAGVGKSLLLRWLGLRLLAQNWLPVWLEGDALPENPGELAVYLTEQLGLSYELAQVVASEGLERRRIIFLIDEAEHWSEKVITQVQWLRGRYEIGGLVTGRAEGNWYQYPTEKIYIVWDSDRLRRVMQRWGNTAWWAAFERWHRKKRLKRRPWEYSLAARVTFEPETESPLAVLTMPITQWKDEEKREKQQGEQYVGRQMAGLMKRAWIEVVEGERRLWRPTGRRQKPFADWGVAKRLLEKSGTGEYWFAHDLWRELLAAWWGYRNFRPEEALEQLVGVPGWEQVVAWMAEFALDDGGVQWAENLLLSIASIMRKGWKNSSWLQGASAVGVLLRELQGKEVVGQVRPGAETALVGLLSFPGPWNAQQQVAEGIGDALLALSPLSEAAVDQLMNLVYGPDARSFGWVGVRLKLAGERTVALRLLRNPGRFAEEAGPRWLWAVARAKLVSEKWGVSEEAFVDRLLDAASRIYRGSGRDTVLNQTQAVIGALSTRGTEVAAQHLGEWLRNEQPRMKDEWYDGWDRRIRDGLQEWRGDLEHLWQSVLEALQTDMPWLAWRACLMGAMDVSKVEGAAQLVDLAEQIGIAWTEGHWEDDNWQRKQEAVLGQLKAWGDERVIPKLVHWWETVPENNSWRQSIHETLWGTETHPGVLGRQETGWLVTWLRNAPLSIKARVTTVELILRQRQANKSMIALGQEWLKQELPALRQAGAYLVDCVDDDQLKLLLNDEETVSGGIDLAARMGRWEIVQPYMERRLAVQRISDVLWDLIGIVGEARYESLLPLLVRRYVIDRDSNILAAGLSQFGAESVDAALKEILSQHQPLLEDQAYKRLWALGTPEGVFRALGAIENDESMSYRLGHLGRAYREEIWEMLAEFLESEQGEYVRWDMFGHLRSLWSTNEAWPWGVTACFFNLLDDQDRTIREETQIWLDRVKGVNWKGREVAYVKGLREFALQGTDNQQRMGLRCLAWMPSDVAQDVWNWMN